MEASGALLSKAMPMGPLRKRILYKKGSRLNLTQKQSIKAIFHVTIKHNTLKNKMSFFTFFCVSHAKLHATVCLRRRVQGTLFPVHKAPSLPRRGSAGHPGHLAPEELLT